MAPTHIKDIAVFESIGTNTRYTFLSHQKFTLLVTMMQEEQKPNVTYSDVGGCQEPTEKLREALETPLLDVIQPLSYISIKEIPMLLYCVSSRRDS